MEWQDYIVWAIGLAVAAVVVRWLWRLVCGKRHRGCASCASVDCPLKKIKN